MKLDNLTNLHWLEPWYPASSANFEAELAREVSPAHPLFGLKAICVGRRYDCDDVLFFLPNNPSPLAVVHLTWSLARESFPNCPRTAFYASLDDWVERCMKVDHIEFE